MTPGAPTPARDSSGLWAMPSASTTSWASWSRVRCRAAAVGASRAGIHFAALACSCAIVHVHAGNRAAPNGDIAFASSLQGNGAAGVGLWRRRGGIITTKRARGAVLLAHCAGLVKICALHDDRDGRGVRRIAVHGDTFRGANSSFAHTAILAGRSGSRSRTCVLWSFAAACASPDVEDAILF